MKKTPRDMIWLNPFMPRDDVPIIILGKIEALLSFIQTFSGGTKCTAFLYLFLDCQTLFFKYNMVF